MRVKVHVLPAGKDLRLKVGTNLRLALIEAGIPLDSVCAGQATCLKCKVRVSGVSGKLTEPEREKLSPEELHNGWRLACQVTVEQPGEVRVPELEISRVKAGFGLLGEAIPLQPNVRLRHFELGKPTISDQKADWDRLAEYLELTEGSRVNAELSLVAEIPERLREWNFKGGVVLVGDTVVALEPPDSTQEVLGVALDIGTTTLAAGLVNLDTGKVVTLDAELNPQTAFGADVITRILYMMQGSEEKQKLQGELVRGVNRVLHRICRLTGRDRERIFEMTVVGNTTMLHTLLGLDAQYLARAPYVGVLNRSLSLPAAELGLQIHPQGRVHILPSIASFVGADTTAVILATRLYQSNAPRLAIDIGTNGEIMLGVRKEVLTASTAAGPAFEGARIKYGMRAVKGAISSFQATPSLEYTVIGGTVARGICGSGLIDLVAELYRAGVIDRKGRLLLPSDAPALPTGLAERIRARNGDREFILCQNEAAEVTLTQQDVRELQLAKGAIRCGIELLMKEAGVNVGDIKEVLLSGVFGNYINRQKAVTLGLIPPLPLEKIHFIGNGAMDGALRALISLEERHLADEIATRVHHIELSGRPDFEETFLRYLDLG